MENPVSFRRDEFAAVITMDDGKVNAMSPTMFVGLNDALDQAEASKSITILTGRPGRFSAGFDLSVISRGDETSAALLNSGFEMAYRILSFPYPVIIASTGHAIAMGVFLTLAADYRIGAQGAFKYTANEVAIGMTMPYTIIELARQRLTPSEFNRALNMAEIYSPDDALRAGFLDQVVAPDDVEATALAVAERFSKLDMRAHKATKLRTREQALRATREAIERDFATLS